MAIGISIIFSKVLFTSYQTETVMTSSGNVYILQYASFTNKEVMNENIKKLDDYLIYEMNNKYYVYLGIYTSLDTAMKMKKYFENDNIYTYIKNDYLQDNSLVNKIKDYDLEILNEENNSKIIDINKKILNLVKTSVS